MAKVGSYNTHCLIAYFPDVGCVSRKIPRASTISSLDFYSLIFFFHRGGGGRLEYFVV